MFGVEYICYLSFNSGCSCIPASTGLSPVLGKVSFGEAEVAANTNVVAERLLFHPLPFTLQARRNSTQ